MLLFFFFWFHFCKYWQFPPRDLTETLYYLWNILLELVMSTSCPQSLKNCQYQGHPKNFNVVVPLTFHIQCFCDSCTFGDDFSSPVQQCSLGPLPAHLPYQQSNDTWQRVSVYPRRHFVNRALSMVSGCIKQLAHLMVRLTIYRKDFLRHPIPYSPTSFYSFVRFFITPKNNLCNLSM